MKTAEFEKMCKDVGLMQEAKVSIRNGEVLVADGEPNKRGKAYLLKMGAVHLGQFPDGYYMTAWNMENKKYPLTGKFLFFDKNHDRIYDERTRKCLRVDKAIEDSIQIIEMMRNAQSD